MNGKFMDPPEKLYEQLPVEHPRSAEGDSAEMSEKSGSDAADTGKPSPVAGEGNAKKPDEEKPNAETPDEMPEGDGMSGGRSWMEDFSGGHPLVWLADRAAEEPDSPLSASLRDSLLKIEGFRQGEGLDNAELEGALSAALLSARDMANGQVSLDALRLLHLGMNHDRLIARARAEGEVAGRNARIEEMLAGSAASGKRSAPTLGGTAASPSRKTQSIFDLAREA